MARIGSGIRPELGRADYSPIARGGQVAGASISKAGSELGDFLKRQKDAKKEAEEGKARLEAFAAVTTDPNIRQFVEQQAAYIADEENPLSKRLARARSAGDAINIFQKKTDQDIAKVLAGQEFMLRQQEMGIRQSLLPHQIAGYQADIELTKARTKNEITPPALPVEYKATPVKQGDDEILFWHPENAPPTSGVPLSSAPRTKMTPSPEEKARGDELSAQYKASAGRVDKVIEGGSNSDLALAKAQRTMDLLEAGNFTGFGSGIKGELARIGSSLGMKTNAKNYEEVGVYLGDFVMERVSQTKGAVSQKEMELFQKYAANPKKSVEGNKAILKAYMAVEERRKDLAKLAQQELIKGTPSFEIEQKINAYKEANPVFPRGEIGGSSEGGPEEKARPVPKGSNLDILRRSIDPQAQYNDANPLLPPKP